MSEASKWNDLRARVISAVVLLVVGLVLLWIGGTPFHLFVAAAGGGLIWELTRMMPCKNETWPIQAAGMAFVALSALLFVPGIFVFPLLLSAVLVGVSGLAKDKGRYAIYATGVIFACFGLILLRDARGIEWVLWLIAVVVATDVAGYFAGKTFGGPKFWPSLSPKKTWAGTSAGWIAAFFVGLAFGGFTLGLVSMALSFASQLGDISESAVKRRAGVKDSSALIPGHGGLLDRFDGLLAAALLMLVIFVLFGVPH